MEKEDAIESYFKDKTGSKPNIILIVLESVGAKNIFPASPYKQA